MDEQLQAQALEDLRVIRRMVAQTTGPEGPYWLPFFVWGALGVVASLASHLCLVRGWYAGISVVWFAYCLVGVLATRPRRLPGRRSFLERTLANTWRGVLIAISLLFVALVAGHAFPPQFTGGLMAVLVGLGLFVTAGLLESPVWYAAAAIWWAGGLLQVMRPELQFLLQAGMFVLGYLAPGVLARRQARDLEAVRAPSL